MGKGRIISVWLSAATSRPKLGHFPTDLEFAEFGSAVKLCGRRIFARDFTTVSAGTRRPPLKPCREDQHWVLS